MWTDNQSYRRRDARVLHILSAPRISPTLLTTVLYHNLYQPSGRESQKQLQRAASARDTDEGIGKGSAGVPAREISARAQQLYSSV